MLQKRYLFLLLILMFNVALAQPTFVTPTPANHAYTGNTNYTQINATITEENLNSLIYNWNGANFSYVDNSLVLLLNLNEVVLVGENTVVNDSSLHSNDGFVAGGSIVPGKYRGGYNFDGINDAIRVSDDNSLDAIDFTFSHWVKSSENVSNVEITQTLNKNTADAGSTYVFSWSHNQAGFRKSCSFFDGVDWNKVSINNPLYSDVWYHISCTYNGSLLSLFLDGQLVNYTDVVATPQVGNADLFIGSGAGANSAAAFFNGVIDDVRIWNRSLTESEIYQVYVSNLEKTNTNSWNLYVNQSQNATHQLVNGSYSYFVGVTNTTGDYAKTTTRIVNIGFEPETVPEWSDYLLFLILGVVISGYVKLRKEK